MKSIIHFFENHIQYGDIQIKYDDDFLPKTLEEQNNQIRKGLENEEDDMIC